MAACGSQASGTARRRLSRRSAEATSSCINVRAQSRTQPDATSGCVFLSAHVQSSGIISRAQQVGCALVHGFVMPSMLHLKDWVGAYVVVEFAGQQGGTALYVAAKQN